MDWLLELRLIRLFEFYLVAIFAISTYLRVQQYRSVLGLVRAVPDRWPRLFELIKKYRHIFLTWGTLLPLIISFVLLLAHTIATRIIWPQAGLTVEKLIYLWPALIVVVASGAGMILFDVIGTIQVAEIESEEIEKYFDQAEYWLRSRMAPVVRYLSLGYVNPRQMVADEVKTALVEASRLLNDTLWWVATQASLRIAFGLSLWLTYAFEEWLSRLVGG